MNVTVTVQTLATQLGDIDLRDSDAVSSAVP